MPSPQARRGDDTVTHCSRLALVLAMLAPAAASAQFTTFVPAPAARVSDSAHAVVAAVQKARTDSITHTTLTNMKAWVDSAAGSLATTDSAGAPGDSTRAGATVATTT